MDHRAEPDRSARPARLVGPLAVVLTLLLLAGCGDVSGSPSPSAAHDTNRENEVAGDRSATAREIIDAGGPVRVAASKNRTLVAWRADFEDDEGPQQAAWRLYDGAGERIADGRLGLVVGAGAIPTLTSVPDGFLVENYTGHVLRHIDRDGAIADVPSSQERRATQAGDVLQESLEGSGWTFYRPAEQTSYRLPKVPISNPQGVVLDEDGRVWVLGDWSRTEADVASSAGGIGPWRHTQVTLPRGGAPSGPTVAAGQVLVPTMTSDLESPRLAGLWSHPVDGDPAAEWTRVPTTGVTFEDTLQPGVAALRSGRLVLTGDRGEVWIQGDDGTFARLILPRGLGTGFIEVVGSRMFLSFTRDHQLHASDDAGTTWHVVER